MLRIRLLAAGLTLLGAAHAGQQNPDAYELAVVDMQGQKKVLGTLPGTVFAPRVSPDGRHVAYEAADAEAGPQSLRLHVASLDKLDEPKALPFTVITKRNLAPIWSPDGNWLAFVAMGNGNDALFWQRADGSVQPLYLIDGRAVEGMYEGGLLTFITLTGNRDYGIAQLDVNTKQVTPLIDYPGTEQHSARISPDAKWIAYVSNETGRQEVWLEPLPQNGKRHQLTRNGGRHPQWSPDGTKIYFDDQRNQMFRLDLTINGDSIQAGAPVRLPISGFVQGDLRRQYDLMPDGKGFLMMFAAGNGN